jgi:hypothetical protein
MTKALKLAGIPQKPKQIAFRLKSKQREEKKSNKI